MISQIIALLSISLIYFLNVFSRMQFSLLISHPSSINLFFVPNKGAILLFLAFGFGISLFLSQYASTKLSYLKVVTLCSFCAGLWLILLPWMARYIPLHILLFTYGILTGFFLPAAIAYLNHLFSSTTRAKAIGFFSSFQTLAMILAPLLANPKIIFPIGCSFIFLSIGLALIKKKTEAKESPPTLKFFESLIQSKLFWAFFFFQCLAVGLNVGVYISAPACFIQENCLESNQLLSLLSLSRIIGAASPLLFSFLLDMSDLRATLTITSLLAGLFTILLGICPLQAAPYLLCCQAPFAIAMTTIVYIAISQYSPPFKKAAVLSLFSSLSFIAGAGLLPQLIDLLGTMKLFHYGFIFLGILTCIAAISFFRSSALNSALNQGEIL